MFIVLLADLAFKVVLISNVNGMYSFLGFTTLVSMGFSSLSVFVSSSES